MTLIPGAALSVGFAGNDFDAAWNFGPFNTSEFVKGNLVPCGSPIVDRKEESDFVEFETVHSPTENGVLHTSFRGIGARFSSIDVRGTSSRDDSAIHDLSFRVGTAYTAPGQYFCTNREVTDFVEKSGSFIRLGHKTLPMSQVSITHSVSSSFLSGGFARIVANVSFSAPDPSNPDVLWYSDRQYIMRLEMGENGRYRIATSGLGGLWLKTRTTFPKIDPDSWTEADKRAVSTQPFIQKGTHVTYVPLPMDFGALRARAYIREHVDFQTAAFENEALVSTADVLSGSDINMLSFSAETLAFKEMIEPVIDIARTKGKAILDPDNYSGYYLWYHYGVRLSFKDYKQILSDLVSAKPLQNTYGIRARSKRSLYIHGIQRQITFSMKSYLTDRIDAIAAEARRGLDAGGFSINMKNLWDLVPYSFVVDWIVNLSDYMELWDKGLLAFDTYECQKRVFSWSIVSRLDSSGYLPRGESVILGNVLMKTYFRDADSKLPSPTLSEIKLQIGYDKRHNLEATALILERRK